MPKKGEDTKAHQRYRNVAGQIVPGVTTILGVLNKPALVPWAWKLGMEGQDYRKVVDKAADIGTIAHGMVEAYLNGKAPDFKFYPAATVELALIPFSNFVEWWEQQALRMITTEHSVVSEIMQCGGAIDCVAQHSTGLWRIDIKASKGVWDEMLYQVAAYWAMWNECYPERPIQSAHIVHLDKQSGALNHHRYPALFKELEIFRLCRAIYELQKSSDPKRRLDRLYRKFNLERL